MNWQRGWRLAATRRMTRSDGGCLAGYGKVQQERNGVWHGWVLGVKLVLVGLCLVFWGTAWCVGVNPGNHHLGEKRK